MQVGRKLQSTSFRFAFADGNLAYFLLYGSACYALGRIGCVTAALCVGIALGNLG
jgi:hypothetical protein